MVCQGLWWAYNAFPSPEQIHKIQMRNGNSPVSEAVSENARGKIVMIVEMTLPTDIGYGLVFFLPKSKFGLYAC